MKFLSLGRGRLFGIFWLVAFFCSLGFAFRDVSDLEWESVLVESQKQVGQTPGVLGVADEPDTSSSQHQGSLSTYRVTKVRDGDTFEILYEGKSMAVRMVGIDTPETVDPRKPVQCFGKQASNKLKEILTGAEVSLEVDETQQDRDRYGRLLRFVFLDGEDVGLRMIQDGYARESLYSSVPHKYRTAYLEAQQQAKENEVGLWAPEACGE